MNRTMEALQRAMAIKPLHTSSYHPQTNGLTERFNRTMMEMLRMYTSAHQHDWEHYLPYVQFAYNTSVHEVSKDTPHYLVYGRDPIVPGDIINPADKADRATLASYRAQRIRNWQRIKAEVERYNEKARQYRESRTNATRHDPGYELGELVWMFNNAAPKGKTHKLMQIWHGPFRVIAKPSEMNVVLQNISSRKETPPVHVSRVKRYYGPVPPSEVPNDVVMDEDDDSAPTTQEPATAPSTEAKSPGKQSETVQSKSSVSPEQPLSKLLSESPKLKDAQQDVADGKKRKKKRASKQPEAGPDDEDNDGTEKQYDVEKIIGVRIKGNGKREFLVKWLDYDDSWNIWLPEDTIREHCSNLVDEFLSPKPWRCDECGFAAFDARGLRHHVRTNHKNQPDYLKEQ